MDTRGRGLVSQTELRNFLGVFGETPSVQEIKELCTAFQLKNEDLNFMEFVSIMSAMQPGSHEQQKQGELEEMFDLLGGVGLEGPINASQIQQLMLGAGESLTAAEASELVSLWSGGSSETVLSKEQFMNFSYP